MVMMAGTRMARATGRMCVLDGPKEIECSFGR